MGIDWARTEGKKLGVINFAFTLFQTRKKVLLDSKKKSKIQFFRWKQDSKKRNFDIFKFWQNSIWLFLLSPSLSLSLSLSLPISLFLSQPLCTFEKTCFKLESPKGLLGLKNEKLSFKKFSQKFWKMSFIFLLLLLRTEWFQMKIWQLNQKLNFF